jgi:DNA-binding transcriptional LysR family regulator
MLLLTEAGCAYGKKLDELLAVHKVRAGNTTEFSSVEAIKQCATAGMGIGCLQEKLQAACRAAERLNCWEKESQRFSLHR